MFQTIDNKEAALTRLEDLRVAYVKLLSDFPTFERQTGDAEPQEYVVIKRGHELSRFSERDRDTEISCINLELISYFLALRNYLDQGNRANSGVMQFNIPPSDRLLEFLEEVKEQIPYEFYLAARRSFSQMDLTFVNFHSYDSEINLTIYKSLLRLYGADTIFDEIRSSIEQTRALYVTSGGKYSSIHINITGQRNSIPRLIDINRVLKLIIPAPYSIDYISEDHGILRIKVDWNFEA